MSYFPDYRKETNKLNKVDRAYIGGYRHAVEDVMTYFDNVDGEDLSIVKEITEKLKESLAVWMECEEIELVCALFNEADYLPEDIDLKDANEIT